ncbi:MAG: hypothetical protein ABI402_08970 [Ferruginibacter sp.]
MKKNEEVEKSNVAEEPIVIPDECGDSMWDSVLEQSAFVQALRQTENAEPQDKKDKSLK